MDVMFPTFLLLRIAMLFIANSGYGRAKYSVKREMKFRKSTDPTGVQLPGENVISSYIVYGQVECSLRCLQESKCVAYNHRSTSNEYLANCELSKKTRERREETESDGSGGWTLYQSLETLLGKNDKQLEQSASPVNFLDSKILHRQKTFTNQLKLWLPSSTSWSLCYRATRNGWSANTFHSNCDSKGATVTIIQVGSYIFGGYTDVAWRGDLSGYQGSQNAFIFSFLNRGNIPPFKSDVKPDNSQYAIYTHSNVGPTFGGGHDIHIADNAGSSTSSYANFGHTYNLPNGYANYKSETRSLLAGSYNFKPSEIEVFCNSYTK